MKTEGAKVKALVSGELYHLKCLRVCRILVITCFISLLTACVPSGEQNINTELFKSKEDMSERIATLKPGMSKKAVFEKIGVKQDRFEKLSTRDLQMCLYGNAQVQGTPDQLEQFRKRMTQYEAFALPYREIKSSNSIGFGKMRVEKTGHDLRLLLLFQDGKLSRHTIDGTEALKQTEEEYLWKTLFSRGVGLLF
jgi:hypothetical protein